MSFVSVEESGVQVAGEQAAPATIVGSAVEAVEESELRYVALSKLVPSPFNVRKSGGQNIDELAMLIDSQGLLQNLVVIEHITQAKKPTDKFEVVAGGRRLRALRKLADCGKIARDEEILCKVTTRDKALASSAAENSGREPMNVPDTVQAFADMVNAGAGVEEVAVCFGITPLTVRRRLKLANVSPKLFDLFRQGEVDLEQMMALAVSEDHEAQERVWESLDSYERNATNIRRYLLGQAIEAARDPVVKFVGLDAYEAAGGVITRDLFAEEGDQGYVANAELLYRLAKDKLDAEAEKLGCESWKWIETRTSFDYSQRHAFGEAPMGMRDPTDKEKVKLETLAKEQEEAEAALEALYDGEEDDVDQDKADALETRADKARRETEKIHAKMRRYTPEALAIAGAVVSIDHAGAICIHRGLVKPEDKKEAKKVAAGPKNGTSGDGGGESGEGDARAISEALHRKLTAHRTKALQVLVAANAPVALASVVHVLLQQVVIEHSYRAESALAIRANDCDGALGQFADDMEGSKAAAELKSRLDAWRERIPGDADKLFAWLLGQDQGTLLDLLALCAALTINTVTASEQGHPGDDMAKAVGLDMADWWTPTATSYLQQVPKARIVEAVTEAVSAEAGAALAKLKKGEAVVKAEAQLAGTRWLPHALRPR